MKINNYDYSIIGERIQRSRKAKRYTQAELSEMINMSSKNLSQLERGMTGLSVSTLMALCRSLDISADYILFGENSNHHKSSIDILLSELSEQDKSYAENILKIFAESCKNHS